MTKEDSLIELNTDLGVSLHISIATVFNSLILKKINHRRLHYSVKFFYIFLPKLLTFTWLPVL